MRVSLQHLQGEERLWEYSKQRRDMIWLCVLTGGLK